MRYLLNQVTSFRVKPQYGFHSRRGTYSLPSIKIDIKAQELALRRSAPQRLIFHWEGSKYELKTKNIAFRFNSYLVWLRPATSIKSQFHQQVKVYRKNSLESDRSLAIARHQLALSSLHLLQSQLDSGCAIN